MRLTLNTMCASAFRLAVVVLWVGSSLTVSDARAQGPRETETSDEVLIETDALSLDPLGTGGTTDLRDVPIPSSDPPEPLLDPARGLPNVEVDAIAGEYLTALPGVRELDHRVHVRLIAGLAEVEVTSTLTNSSRFAAEVQLRVPAPSAPRIVALSACDAAQDCVTGTPSPMHRFDDAVRARKQADGPSLAAAAIATQDEQGHAILVKVAPVHRSTRTLVRVRYIVPAPIVGGVARFMIPARGRDLRAAIATATVDAGELLGAELMGAPAGPGALVEASEPITLHATASSVPQLTAWRFPCPDNADQTCAHLHRYQPPAARAVGDVVLLIDTSPSITPVARARMRASLVSFFRSVPADTRVYGVAFASLAQQLLAEPLRAGDALPEHVAELTRELDLGSATRFESAWRVLEPILESRPRRRALDIVLVGDGGVTDGAGAEAAFRAARRRGAVISQINVDEPTGGERVAGHPLLRAAVRESGGASLTVPEESKAALRGDSSALDDRMRALFVRRGRGLRLRGPSGVIRIPGGVSGESVSWSGVVHPRARIGGARLVPPPSRLLAGLSHPAASAFTTLPAVPSEGQANADADREETCEHGPASSPLGLNSEESRIAYATRHTCVVQPSIAPPSDEVGLGVPAETVLAGLRQRVVPAARACLRRDRAGRANYSVRATFHVRLRNREIVEARVAGEISEALRACLLQSVDRLAVPTFRGTIAVRYPIHTQREAPPPTIALEGDVEDRVNSLFGRATEANTRAP